jgi:hypothetical protein
MNSNPLSKYIHHLSENQSNSRGGTVTMEERPQVGVEGSLDAYGALAVLGDLSGKP